MRFAVIVGVAAGVAGGPFDMSIPILVSSSSPWLSASGASASSAATKIKELRGVIMYHTRFE